MINKRLILVVLAFMLVSIPLGSALTLTDPSTWDDTVKFHETSPNGNFGYYEIGDTFLWVFAKKQIKTVELIENDYSVLSAWNIKQIEVFSPTKLFDRVDYYARDKETDRSSAIKSEQHLYRQFVNKTRYINVQGDCTQFNTITNGTTYCINYEDLSYDETTEEWTEWEDYNWHSVQPGLYQTKTIVTRKNKYTGMVDWIDTSEGHKLKEWAAWWDNSWNYRANITALNTSISALYNITYNAHMQGDFDDLRFLDYATESVELNYSIISKIDSTYALVRVDNLNVTEIMMYYGNGAVSSNSNFEDIYFGAIAGYTFDGTGGGDSSTSGFDGTVTGSPTLENGKIGNAYTYDGGGTQYISMGNVMNPGTGAWSSSAWIKSSSTGSYQQIVGRATVTATDTWLIRITNAEKVQCEFRDGVSSDIITSSATVTDGNWHFITCTRPASGGTIRLYIDNSPDGTTGNNNYNVQSTVNFRIGEADGASSHAFNGDIDEVYIWDKELSQTEITKLYYQTVPPFVVGTEESNLETTLTQLQPVNGLTTDELTNYFAYNITTESLNFTNTTLSVWNDTDDTLEITNFTSLSGNTSQIINWTNTLPDGDWKWNAEVCDTTPSCVTGSNRTLTIDTTPFIVFNATTPVNNSEIISDSFTAAVNLTEKYFDSLTFNLYNDSGIIQTATYTNSTRQHTFTSLSQGLYFYNATVSTNTSQSNSTERRIILVHLGLPEILIFDPSGFQGSIIIGENETLNYSITEIGQNVSTHLVECWFEYNNTEIISSFTDNALGREFPTNYANVTEVRVQVLFGPLINYTNIPQNCSRAGNITLTSISNSTGSDLYCYDDEDNTIKFARYESVNAFAFNSVKSMVKRPLNCTGSLESFEYVEQKNGLCVHAIDEFGLHQENTTTWNYEIVEVSQTYNSQTTEGAIETFEAGIVLDPTFTISAVAVVYNGTNYVGSSSTSGGIITLETSTVLIPSVSAETNFTFNWVIVLSDLTVINLSTQTQTVINLVLDDCSSFSNILFNFTSKDEELQTQLSNTTKEIAINVFSRDRAIVAFNLSGEYTSNPTAICLNNNLTSGITYSLDAIIRYKASGYTNEYYNIVNFNLSSESEVQEITLYNLNLSDSTEFQLTFQGEDFLPVENALVFVERRFIAENTFKTVELPKTDSNGQTVLHLVRNEIIYNIIVMKDGEILGVFTNLIAFCEDFSIGDCKITLNAIREDSSNFDYNEQIGIVFNNAPMFNETTNEVSFSFVSVDGTSRAVVINAERRDIFGNTSVCTNTLVATSGTVSCNVGNITDSTLVTGITVDGEEWIVSPVQIDSEAYGSIGYVATFFLTLVLMLYLGDSKNGVMLSIAIGYIVAVSMGFMIGGIIGAGTAGIWMIVLTVLGLYQINKNKT